MESSPSEAGDLAPPISLEHGTPTPLAPGSSEELLPEPILRELWSKAEAGKCELSVNEFAGALSAVGTRTNHGLPAGNSARLKEKVDFFRSLHLPELALAHACALGREVAWVKFAELYRVPLVQAAIGITRSASLGEELADSLHAELYGLRERQGERSSPFASYSGRGSLLSWLRTTLVQRYRDHLRRTHRETSIEGVDCATSDSAVSVPENLSELTEGVAQTIHELGAEDRYLLAAYFLDRQTLLQIARTLHVHEATISRRIKRLTAELRDKLLEKLHRRGLSKAAAKEALGTDPRDIEINLRAILQTSPSKSFSLQGSDTQNQEPESR